MRPRTATAKTERRCVAPLEDGEAGLEHLCGEPATEQRTVEEVVLDLCAAHAAELDEERKQN